MSHFNQRATQRLLLALALAVSAAARLPGIANGLPEYPGADEPVIFEGALRVAQGRLNPHFFDWPGSLQLYVNGAAYYTYFQSAKLAGPFAPEPSIQAAYENDPRSFFLISRLLNVASGLALVLVVFQATVSLGPIAAGFSALTVGLSPVVVRESTAAMTDVPATLFLMIALAQSGKLVGTPTAKGFLLVGLIIGLGCAIKYYVCVAVVGILVAAWLAPIPRRGQLRLMGGTSAGIVMGFLIGCPYSLLAFDEFSADVAAQFQHQSGGHVGADRAGWPIWSYIATQLAPATTMPVLIAGCAGLYLVVRRRYRWLYPTAACAIVYLIFAAASEVSFKRYAVPHVPMVALLAAPLMAHAARSVSWRASLALLLLVSPLVGTTKVCRSRLRTDVRHVVGDWLRAEVPTHAQIARTIYAPLIPGAPRISPHIPVPEKIIEGVRRRRFDYVLLDSSTTGRMYLPATQEKHPEIVASHRALHALVEHYYELQTVFSPGLNGKGPRISIYASHNEVKSTDTWIPVAGDWDGDGTDTLGLLSTLDSKFHLFADHAADSTNTVVIFELVWPGALPIVGDWDGDGKESLGLFDPEAGKFFLKDQNTDGRPDHVVRFGPKGGGWIPLAGDWNGDGKTTVGLYAPEEGNYYLKNDLLPGRADHVHSFAAFPEGVVPLAGDWTGQGIDLIGAFDPILSRFALSNRRNKTDRGVPVQFISLWKTATIRFRFAWGGVDWLPLVGDWDGDGIETVGLYDPLRHQFFLRNEHAPGPADVTFERLPE